MSIPYPFSLQVSTVIDTAALCTRNSCSQPKPPASDQQTNEPRFILDFGTIHIMYILDHLLVSKRQHMNQFSTT